MSANLTATTTTTTAYAGTDANGNAVNLTLAATPVVNTAVTEPYSVPWVVSTGTNTFTVPTGQGYTMATVTPPTGSSVSVNLGASTGQAIAPGLPFSFGLSGGAFVLYLGTVTGTVAFQVTLG